MVRLPNAAGQVRSAPVKALRGFFAGIGQLLLAADRFRADEAERDRSGDGQHDAFTTMDRQPAGHDQAPGPDSAPGRDAAPGRVAPRTGEKGSGDGHPAEQRRFRSLDSTGNVRVLTSAEIAGAAPETAGAAPETAGAAAQTAGAAPQTADAAPQTADAAPEAEAPTGADGPSPGAGAAKPAAMPAVPAARTAPRVPTAQVPAAVQAPTARRASAGARAPAAETASPAPASLPVPGYDGLSLPSLRSRLRVLDAAQLRVLVRYEKSNARREAVVTMFERRIAKLEAAGPDAS